MFRQVIVRRALYGALAFAVAVAVFLHLRHVYHLSLRVAALEARTESAAVHGKETEQKHVPRLEALEMEVFGVLPQAVAATDATVEALKKRPPPAGPEAWQRTRDRELRQRLAALEQWRLKMETGK